MTPPGGWTVLAAAVTRFFLGAPVLLLTWGTVQVPLPLMVIPALVTAGTNWGAVLAVLLVCPLVVAGRLAVLLVCPLVVGRLAVVLVFCESVVPGPSQDCPLLSPWLTPSAAISSWS